MYVVYTHWHPFYGTFYVGRSKDVQRRWQYKEWSYRGNQELVLMMQVFGGWDGCYHSIVGEFVTERGMKLAETYWMLRERTVGKEKGNKNWGNGFTELFGKDWKKPSDEWVYENREWLMELLADEIWQEEGKWENWEKG